MNWNDIEEVTAIVEEYSEVIVEEALFHEYDVYSKEIVDIAINKESVFLYLRDKLWPIALTKTAISDIIEQHTTEIIDDNENGFRRGE